MKTANLKSKLKSYGTTKLLRSDTQKPIIRKSSTVQLQYSFIIYLWLPFKYKLKHFFLLQKKFKYRK